MGDFYNKKAVAAIFVTAFMCHVGGTEHWSQFVWGDPRYELCFEASNFDKCCPWFSLVHLRKQINSIQNRPQLPQSLLFVIHNLTRKACPTCMTQGRCVVGRVMHIIAIASVFPILYFLTGGRTVSIKKCVVYLVHLENYWNSNSWCKSQKVRCLKFCIL